MHNKYQKRIPRSRLPADSFCVCYYWRLKKEGVFTWCLIAGKVTVSTPASACCNRFFFIHFIHPDGPPFTLFSVLEDIVFACRVPFFFLLGGRKCCSCWTGFGFRYVKCARWGGSNQRKYSVPPDVWQSNRVFLTLTGPKSALLVGMHTQQACLLGEYIDRSTWRSNITRLSTEKTQQQLGVTQQTSKRNSSMFLNNLFFKNIFIFWKIF